MERHVAADSVLGSYIADGTEGLLGQGSRVKGQGSRVQAFWSVAQNLGLRRVQRFGFGVKG
eukprot:622514-Rhodomonas_salina.2